MNGQPEVYETLDKLNIDYKYYEHDAVPTAEDAARVKVDVPGTFCKNLFFRNHKGNRHYLVILQHDKQLDIMKLVKLLKQGRLSFASEKRLTKHLGLKSGSVSPFGLVNDIDAHVYMFIDSDLKDADYISFHPNINTASLLIKPSDLIKFVEDCGNKYEFIEI